MASSPLRESPEKPRSPPSKSRRQALEEGRAASPGGTAAAGAYAPRLRDEPPHGHSLLPQHAQVEYLEDWYRWFWGRDIADRRPAPNEQVLLYAERNAWREIHNLVCGGLGLKEAMTQIKQDTLFWTRDVYESVARQKGHKGSMGPDSPGRQKESSLTGRQLSHAGTNPKGRGEAQGSHGRGKRQGL